MYGVIKTLLSSLLLFFYIGGNLSTLGLHRLLHAHDHIVTHDEEQEQNACHRAIYHAEAGNGCGHDFHYAIPDDCDACDIALQKDPGWIADGSDDIFSGFQVFHSCQPVITSTVKPIALPSRAPPVLLAYV